MDGEGRPTLRSGKKRLYQPHPMGHHHNLISSRGIQGATLLSDSTSRTPSSQTGGITHYEQRKPRSRGKNIYEQDTLDEEPPPTPTPSSSYSMRKRKHESDLGDHSVMTTVSVSNRRGKRYEEEDYYDQLPPTPAKYLREGGKKRRLYEEDYLEEPPDTPSSSTSPTKRSRFWEDVNPGSRYAPSVASSMYANVSSTSSICSEHPSLNSSYNTDYIYPVLGFDMDHTMEVDRSVALSSTNDPFFTDASKKTGDSNELDTPTHSPPATPSPRPGTPGISSPLSPSMDTGIEAGALVDDDDDRVVVIDNDDSGSLVGATNLSHLGPLPTQMCHSRVGNVLSSSTSSIISTSTCSSLLMQKFSISRSSSITSPTSTVFGAPPTNILESDEDDSDPEVVIVYENNSNSSHSNSPSTTTNIPSPLPHPSSQSPASTSITENINVNNPTNNHHSKKSSADNDDHDDLASIFNTSKTSPDIVTGYIPNDTPSSQSAVVIDTPEVDDDEDLGTSFLDTAGSTFSNKHSHRLRIRPLSFLSSTSKLERHKCSRSSHSMKTTCRRGEAGRDTASRPHHHHCKHHKKKRFHTHTHTHSHSHTSKTPIPHTITSILKKSSSTTNPCDSASSMSPPQQRPSTSAGGVKFKNDFLKSSNTSGGVEGRRDENSSKDRRIHSDQGSSGYDHVFLVPAPPKAKRVVGCRPTDAQTSSMSSSPPIVNLTTHDNDKNDEEPDTTGSPPSTEETSHTEDRGALPGNVVDVQRTPATQLPQFSNHEGYIRDGNIIYLKMTNFMTYAAEEWYFKPGVTFLQGKNGSGKSAIQLGMKMLFGGKAASTLRANVAYKLIKWGTLFAELEGHLTNYNGTVSKGKYGEIIQMKRRINETCSTYKIKGNDGRWRKMKTAEQTVLLRTLNIDPDNPFQFLQQDHFPKNSKQGSSSQSRKDFIKFNDATKLSEIKNMLNESEENIKIAELVVVDKEEDRKSFTLKEKQLKERLDQINRMEMDQNRLTALEVELAWSHVKVVEEELSKVQADRTALDERKTQRETKKKALDLEITNFSSREVRNKAMIDQKQLEIEKLEMLLRAQEQKVMDLKRTQRRAQMQYDGFATTISTCTKNIKKFEREMNTEKTVVDFEAQNQKYREEIEMHEKQIKQIDEELVALRLERDAKREQIEVMNGKEQVERLRIKELEQELREVQQELGKKNNYGPHMTILLDKIERHPRWIKVPLGPIGKDLAVTDKKYAPIIEHILQSHLNGFCVFTKEDGQTLWKLISEVYNDHEKAKARGRLYPPSVTILSEFSPSQAKMFTRMEEKFKNFRTVSKMLRSTEPRVIHALADTSRCERVILFDTSKEAAAVMKDDRNFPPETTSGFTLQWFKVTPYPNYKFQALPNVKHKTSFLPMAREDTSNTIKAEINRRKEEIKTCKFHIEGNNGLAAQLRQHDFKISEKNKIINQLHYTIKNLTSLIKAEPLVSAEVRDVADLIEVERGMLAQAEKDIVMPKKDLENTKEEHARLKVEIEQIKAKLTELQSQMEEMDNHHNGHNQKKARLQKESDRLEVEITSMKIKFEALTKCEDETYYRSKALAKEAEKKGERPKELKCKPEKLKAELKTLRELLDKNRNVLALKPRVHDEYKSCQAHVILVTTEINLIKRLREKFMSLIKITQTFYEQRKDHLSTMLKNNYQILVEAHGVTGELSIDWKAGTLFYFVCPDNGAELRAKTNGRETTEYVLMLSGGERSKSLVFFIMSIWDLIDMPFVVLDEFENCLDAEARHGVHKQISFYASKMREAQFLVLTPLQVEQIPDAVKDFVRMEHVEFHKRRKIDNGEYARGSPHSKKRKLSGRSITMSSAKRIKTDE